MSSFYKGLAKTSSRLIKEKGQLVTINRKIGGVYSPELGAFVGQSEVNVQVPAVVFDIRAAESKLRALGADDVPTDIQYADKKVLFGASVQMVPAVGDFVVIAGIPHAVVNVTTTAPGGVDLLTEARVRAGA